MKFNQPALLFTAQLENPMIVKTHGLFLGSTANLEDVYIRKNERTSLEKGIS